jgi:16S rRNA processing protein RimM
LSELFLIARTISVYGKEGYLKIASFSDFPERFYKLNKVYLDFYGNKKEFIVESVKQIKDFFIIKFKNFNSDKESDILVGKEIFVEEADSVELPEGYYYIHDLIGSKVKHRGEIIGEITDVLQMPANDVYVITGEKGEILIPAVADYLEYFDAGAKELTIRGEREITDEDEN